MPKLIRITTVPLSLNVLLPGQMRFMRENGFDVVMVAGEGKDWAEVLAREECRHQLIPMTRKMTPFADLRSLWALYRFFKKERPDIVHSHTPKAGLLAMLAAKLAGVKIRVHTIAGLRFMTSTGNTRKLLVAMEKLTARAATHVWPNSFSLLKYIKENGLAQPAKLEVIGLGSSNGIDLSRYSVSNLKEDRLESARRSIRFDDDLIYFLSVGRIVHDKGIDELVNAFGRVHEREPRTRLVLVGAFEPDLDPVSREAMEIIMTHPGIIQAGWSDAVEYYMHISFALVHPSHREGFPNVLLQAGAMLCPIICSGIEGNVDVVSDAETGILFEVKNATDLATKMEYALAHPDHVKRYATALRFRIEQHFDQPNVHRHLLERYRQLLK
ncbi:MAG TPA: glycosyltransferase [Chitinophagaceae bacterium]|nr:glycosyltransferase [Chitinophagaceae bacterium]